MTKREQIISTFQPSNNYLLSFNKNSYRYKYYESEINELVNDGFLMFVSKQRNIITYRLKFCLKSKPCVVQCEACRVLQMTKEKVSQTLYDKKQENLVKSIKEPNKLQRLIKIILE